MEPNCLFRFDVFYGRMGSLYGVFIAKQSEVDALMGKEVEFGEVLGKHSEVSLTITPDMITKANVSDGTIQDLLNACGTTVSGLNPIETYEGSEE